MYRIYADNNLICSSKIEELSIINPVINLEVNCAGTFSFILPPSHPYYDTIQRKKTLIDVYRDDDTEPLFEGVCVSDKVDFWKQKLITCEGELAFFNDSNLRPNYRQGLTSRQLLEAYVAEHNLRVEAMKHFTVGEVTARDSNDSITCYTNYQSTMTEIKEDLIDDIGGFLRVRHVEGVRTLDYLAESPRTNNQVIRLGVNLLDLAKNLDTSEIATAIIPLGTILETQTIPNLDERLNIKTAAADTYHPSGADYVYSATAVENFGWIEKVVTWDDVTTVEALLSKGESYLQDIQYENLIIEAKAIDLGLTSDEFQKFKLLDYIRVVSEPHGLDRYFILSKMTINLNNPEQDTITLGIEEPKGMSAKTQNANQRILREIEKLPSNNMVHAAIDSAVENATALITGAEGGYVVIERNSDGQPIEIRIQDALNNPTKIWRWNQNGFGYSSDGGSTYGTAITMDGAIVADYITSGTMSAARIRGGELLVGGSGLAANGSIVVKDSSNNTIAIIDNGGVDLRKGTIKGPSIELGGSSNTNGSLTIKNASGTIIGSWNNSGIVADKGTIGSFSLDKGWLFGGSWLDYLAGIFPNTDDNVFQEYDSQSNISKVAFGMYEYKGQGWYNGRFTVNYNGDLNLRDENGNKTLEATTDGISRIRSNHNMIINAERIYVGTNSTTIWATENNQHLFSLPTAIDSTGRVTNWMNGCIFVNGFLVE